MPICDRCHKEKKNLSFEPTVKSLIFGGFKIKYENRCRACEREIIKIIDRALKCLMSE